MNKMNWFEIGELVIYLSLLPFVYSFVVEWPFAASLIITYKNVE
jgi:hypothetical protein